MVEQLLQTDFERLIHERRWRDLRRVLDELDSSDIAECLIALPGGDEGVIFRILPRNRAAEVFSYLPFEQQERLLGALSNEQTRSLINDMSPDDRAHLLDELPAEVTRRLLETLNPEQLRVTRTLLGYPPDSAGRYMTPEYVRLKQNMTVAEALDHIRHAPVTTETVTVLYVVDEQGILIKDVRLATLVKAKPEQRVKELEPRPLVTVPPTMDREQVVTLFEKYDRIALPVVDDDGQMLGIITVDDVMDVAQAEVTEDMQKMGGSEALTEPYVQASFLTTLRSRGGWLTVLFLGQMLTASVMSQFENQIAAAAVLAVFLPLIISSGGNSGSQAATVIIRALALGELQMREWWRVLSRELATGVALGAFLGILGFGRILLWQSMGWASYGDHHALVGVVMLLSVVGVVCVGTVTGSMLPFVLRALRLDPATSSAPFVATLVDVAGVAIYFGIAMLVLRGTML